MPSFPAADLVVIQAHLLGALESLLDHPAPPGYLRQFLKRGIVATKGAVEGQLARIADRAADEQPLGPPRLRHVRPPTTGPVIDAGTFAAATDVKALPPILRDLAHEGVDAHLLPVMPDGVGTGHRQHVGPLLPLQPTTQRPVVAIDLIARHPRG